MATVFPFLPKTTANRLELSSAQDGEITKIFSDKAVSLMILPEVGDKITIEQRLTLSNFTTARYFPSVDAQGAKILYLY